MSHRPSRNLAVVCGTLAVMAAAGLGPRPGLTQEAAADAAYADMQKTLGIVPGFFREFPQAGIAGAWAEFKTFQLNPNTALSNKTKELIGIAVAAQIPCHYCIYFHTAAAKANGASDEEIREAVAMAAVVRHWSTVLNGTQADFNRFKDDTDTVLRLAGEKAKSASK